MTDFIDPTPDRPMDAVKFLSLLDLAPILAVLEEFYGEPWRHRHPPEAMLRLLALYKLKRLRFLTELWKLLDDETLKLLGFKWKPSYKTVWHWLLRPRWTPWTSKASFMAFINAELKISRPSEPSLLLVTPHPFKPCPWTRKPGTTGITRKYAIWCIGWSAASRT